MQIAEHFEKVFFDNDFDIMLLIGGYGSGKSFAGFAKIVLKAVEEKRKILVVRKVYTTLKESCFEDVQEAADQLELLEEWRFLRSPLEAKNTINKSRIIFKGMDDYRKLKSIKNIDYIVIEEADELTLDDIKELRKRLRVLNIKAHFLLMCNPVSKMSSIYKMFFTEEGFNFNEDELYSEKLLTKIDRMRLEDGREKEFIIKVHHSTYKDNPFLPLSFIYELESEKDPRIRRIAKEGKFGADGEQVLYNATFEKNVYERYVQGKIEKSNLYRGLDWGYATSFTCGLKMAVNPILNELYIYWEYYNRGRSTPELMAGLEPMKEGNIAIYADNTPQTIRDFSDDGYRIYGVGKKDVEYNEMMLRSFSRIVIDVQRCPNAKKEAEECVYKKKPDGSIEPGEYNIDPHSFDAASYGLSKYSYIPLKERLKKFRYIKTSKNRG